jgi:hypothetical protein
MRFCQLAFGDHHATFHQVDDLFLAAFCSISRPDIDTAAAYCLMSKDAAEIGLFGVMFRSSYPEYEFALMVSNRRT